MPRSSVITYSDPEEMEAAHIAARAEITPVGRDVLTACFVRVELEHLWATRVDEKGSRIKHILLNPKRSFITFETGSKPTRVVEGAEMRANILMRHRSGEAFYERSCGEAHWGTVSMPVDTLSLLRSQVAGCCLASPRDTTITIAGAESFAKFQRLHAAAAVLAETAPQVIANPEAAHGLEQAFIEAIVGCLDAGEPEKQTWAQQCHSTIMGRFRRVLEEHPDRALYVPEVSAAINVPERTLRLCCQEYLGMSPKQYLMLRRMSMARRVLLASVPGERNVTDIATSYGFWHFGRFSAVYRSLFNELPSESLRKTVH